MALIRCPECWRDVSNKAEKCPNCGAEIKKRNKGEILSQFVAICTLAVTIISFCTATQSVETSKIALKSTSLNTEPILDIDIDWANDKISVKHETYDMFKIRRVLYGKVRTIAIMTDDCSQISSVELHEEDNAIYLERGNNVEMSCSEEEVEEYNKKFELSLGGNWSPESTDRLNKLEEKVQKRCEEENFIFWGVSPNFHYRYIEIVYSDVYGNTNSQYYIYKDEYRASWRKYKLSKEEYNKYTQNILYNYTYTGDHGRPEVEDKEIMNILFSDKNFRVFEKTKYDNYAEWFANSQFE